MGENFTKNYIKCGDKCFSIEDLVNNVNDYDKSFGLKLKKPEIWCEPERYINIITAKTDMNIASLICCVNGIGIDDYFETDESDNDYGTICKPIGIEHPLFVHDSVLNWDNPKKTYDTNSFIFRCRFLTLILAQFMGKMNRITYKEIHEKFKYKNSQAEKGIILTKDILNDLIKFILITSHVDSSYQNIILLIHEHLSYSKQRYDQSKTRNMLNGHVINVRKGMDKGLLEERFMTDDLAIFNIMKIAYILATNKTNVNVIPKFKDIDGATTKYNLIRLIEALGSEIIRNTKNKKYAPMFKAYCEARPYVHTDFIKESNNNYAINLGIMAISYAQFVLNSKSTDKFIDEMLKGGK